jgi:hypothetical protein
VSDGGTLYLSGLLLIFDYEGKLKDLGYRVLPADKFKLEDDVVNGLQKVCRR